MKTAGTIESILNQPRLRESHGSSLGDRPWLIYGCGSTGRAWAETLMNAGMEVRAFVDRYSSNQKSLPVLHPEACSVTWMRECSLLLGIHNPGTDIGILRAELKTMGFAHVYLTQELINYFPERSHFWLAPASETLRYSDRISIAHTALADGESRNLFLALLDQRLNAAPQHLPAPDPANIYLPPDLPQPVEMLRFIDCGAYTGDTIKNFSRLGHRFSEIVAFEPDPKHFPELSNVLASERATIFLCGVWHCTEQLRFTPNNAASHIADDGDTIIQSVSLDEALPGFAPDFIKMDIEGAESNALRGAIKMISRSRPRLAISVYHKPYDLWEILLLIREWELNYSFYLRSHSYNGFDTVLYALPNT